jgi:hypothetical protein
VDVSLHAESVNGIEMPAIGILHARLVPARAVFYVNGQHPLRTRTTTHSSGPTGSARPNADEILRTGSPRDRGRLAKHGPELDGWGVFRDDDGTFYQLSVRRRPRPSDPNDD